MVWPTVNTDLAACIRHLHETVSCLDEYLQQIIMANQASVNSSTGKTCNMMMFEREVILPRQAVTGSPTETFVNGTEKTQLLFRALSTIAR